MIRSRMSASAGTTWTIFLFWIAQYALLTAQRIVMEPTETASYLIPRACVALVGVTLSFVIAAIIRRYRDFPPRRQIAVTTTAALVACLLHAAANFTIFDWFMPVQNRMEADLASYFMAVVQWFWSYAALAGLLLVLSYSFQTGERDRRIAQLRHEADTAQMRALRYQLNPHFMFNTLNSVAALIARADRAAAETMVENLADFLRASLSLDPQEDIPLAQEIELQSLYLGIESVRFADRLRVEIQISGEAGRGLVPSLILQPLIENVLKYAVTPSVCPVILFVTAKVEAGNLKIVVRNSAGDGAPRQPRSTGVGLANVEARLAARFGDSGHLRTCRERDGGFAAYLSMPYSVAA